MPRKPAKPKVVPLFSRPEVIGLCKRFLREDEFTTKYYDSIKSPMSMYTLIKRYPSRAFWLNLDLGFKLRSLYWFMGEAGKAELDKRWSIFSLDLGPQVSHDVGTAKIGEDVVVERKPQSVADLLKS